MEREDLSAREAAEMFAAVNMATADSLIVCWRAKYDDAYWRPVTAIHEAGSDGNDTTAPDAAWTPLVATPPHPEYPSGQPASWGRSLSA